MKLASLVLAGVLAGFPLLGQVSVAVKPISISGARSALGSNRVGLWTVSLTSRYEVPVDVPHERLTQSFPLLRDIPNRLAEDLLTRQSSNSFWSVAARWGPTLLAAGVAAYGTQDRVPQSIALASLLFLRAQQRSPTPSVYFFGLLPRAHYVGGLWRIDMLLGIGGYEGCGTHDGSHRYF